MNYRESRYRIRVVWCRLTSPKNKLFWNFIAEFPLKNTNFKRIENSKYLLQVVGQMNSFVMVRGVFQENIVAMVKFLNCAQKIISQKMLNDYCFSFKIGVHDCRDLMDELECPSSTRSPPPKSTYPSFFFQKKISPPIVGANDPNVGV